MCLFFWLAFLKNSDAYYEPYLVIGLVGLACMIFRMPCFRIMYGVNGAESAVIDSAEEQRRMERRVSVLALILSAVFSILVAAANYRLFTELELSYMAGGISRALCTAVALVLCLAGGFFAAVNILLFLAESGVNIFSSVFFENKRMITMDNSSTETVTEPEKKSGSKNVLSVAPVSGTKTFILTALFIAAVDCTVLFLAKYPGVLTEDSIWQIEQLLTGEYSNHHPFYHTMLIKLCYNAGLHLFSGDSNAAVAVYSVFQILAVSCCFGYVASTMRLMGVKKPFIVASVLWFAFLPCHFMYSFSVWKDIFFGIFVTVFLVTLFRMLNGIGGGTDRSEAVPAETEKRKTTAGQWILMTVSGLGFCLFRSNGWAVFLVSTLVFLVLFGKKRKKLCALFAGIIMVSFILKNPVLNAIGVSKTDTIESLSIPAQQIARVIDECEYDLTPEQRELLEKVVDVRHVPVYYSEFISNPIKDLVRSTGDQEYIKEHSAEYLNLYIELGLSHPKQYFEAWVEETKGYWNSGYDYWVTVDDVCENELSISRATVSSAVNTIVEQYADLFRSSPLRIFQSIGFHVWLAVILLFAAIVNKSRAGAFMAVPLIINIFTLLAATPVFAEFRYAYSLFCVFPFLVFAAFFRKDTVDNG